MVSIDLEQLRNQIIAKRKDIAEKKAAHASVGAAIIDDEKSLNELEIALRVVERMSPKTVVSETVGEFEQAGFLQLDQLAPNANRRALIDNVQDTISRFGTQEFSVAHVDAALKRVGIEVKGGKFPRSRITNILGKLEIKGVVERTFTGSGRIPNRYKLKETLKIVGN